MAHIARFLGDEGLPKDWTSLKTDAPGGLGAVKKMSDIAPLEFAHANLTRFAWIRKGIEQALAEAGTQVRIVVSESTADWGQLRFELSPAFETAWVPYAPSGGQDRYTTLTLINEVGKMQCPTWDLPAGSINSGGACPGANMGQTIASSALSDRGTIALPVLPPKARAGDKAPGTNLRNAICMSCYATEGRYPMLNVQLGEVVRYWWTRNMLAAGRAEEWITTMLRGIAACDFPDTRFPSPVSERGMLPFRIHSSGDFYSPEYAAAWIELCNRVYEQVDKKIVFWAPTRSWAAGGFDWKQLMSKLKHRNLVVRASGYSIGDYAPGPLYPGGAVGSTSLVQEDNAGQGRDARYDWDCPAYTGEGKTTCSDSINPEDGKPGCRACWVKPDKRINYTTH
jgi:hypothetical protein